MPRIWSFKVTWYEMLLGRRNCFIDAFLNQDEVNEYMHKCRLPIAVRYRIRKFLHYKKTAFVGSKNPMTLVSPAIRSEVALYNYERVLESVPEFRGAPPGFLAAIALALRPLVYGPNELIITINRTSHSMFILNKGRVQWERFGLDGHIIVVRILRQGSYFGERALLKTHARSDCSIRTLTFVEACELRKADVDPIMREYPGVKRIVQFSVMKEILLRNMRNGCLRAIAEQPAFVRLQSAAQMATSVPSLLERTASTSSSNLSDTSIPELLVSLQRDIAKQNKAILKLTKQVAKQQDILNTLSVKE